LAAPDSLCARAADFHHANDYYQYTTGSCSGAASGAASGSVGLLTAQERQELNLPPRSLARSRGGPSRMLRPVRRGALVCRLDAPVPRPGRPEHQQLFHLQRHARGAHSGPNLWLCWPRLQSGLRGADGLVERSKPRPLAQTARQLRRADDQPDGAMAGEHELHVRGRAVRVGGAANHRCPPAPAAAVPVLGPAHCARCGVRCVLFGGRCD
jgi:hypothetical protein